MNKHQFSIISNLFFPKDPAYLRLKMSIRTLISVIIGAAISIPLGMLAMAMASVGALFLSIAIYGYSYREKAKYAAIGSIALITCFAIGIVIKPNFWVSSSILVVSAFFAFYLRRLGAAFTMITIFAWMMLFLAVLITVPTPMLWLACAGIAISTVIAAITNLLVFPEKRSLVFLENFTTHLRLNAQSLSWLIQHLRNHGNKKLFREFLRPLRQQASALLMENQMISGELLSRKFEIGKIADEMLMWQYNLSKAIGNLNDSLYSIFYENKDKDVEDELVSIIRQTLSDILDVTTTISINKGKIGVNFPTTHPNIDKQLKCFQDALIRYDFGTHTNVIYFYNCYTSTERYWQVLSSIRKFHATSS